MSVDFKKDFRILDFYDSIEAGSGDAIVFTYKGTKFIYEIWSTHNACGRDYYAYDDGGTVLAGDRLLAALWDRDDSESVEEFLDQVYNIWLENKEKIVHPALEKAVQDSLVMVWDTLQENDPNDPDSP